MHNAQCPVTSGGYKCKQLIVTLLQSSDKVCKHKPSGVTYSSVFVTITCLVYNLDSVPKLEDLKADDNGAWVNEGKPYGVYTLEFDSTHYMVLSASSIDKIESDTCFILYHVYYHHKSTPQFRRRTAFALNHNGQMVKHAVMQYLFEIVELPIIIGSSTSPPTWCFDKMSKSLLSHSTKHY